jgi:acetyl esterase/lipase/lysophospholipase L1-like esterase
MKKILPFLILFISGFSFAQSQVIPLTDQPNQAPPVVSTMNGVKVEYNVMQPTLTVYPAKGLNTNTAVIIAPGGGYIFLATDHEGDQVAEWLSQRGVTAFVLRYRVAPTENLEETMKEAFSSPGKFQEIIKPMIDKAGKDGMRAVEYVRSNAENFDIDPERIGFMGFSAGGGVTMSVALQSTGSDSPNFIAPVYAYVPETLEDLSVPSSEMPAFIVVAGDDEMQLAPVSFEIYNKWISGGQKAELHAYEQGGHGFGMIDKQLPSSEWIERFGEWLATQGLLWPANPTGWAAGTSYNNRQQWIEKQEELMKNDWPNLGRYAAENSALPAPVAGEKRVVFMGNSITEGWSRVNPDFFKNKPYVNRGIGGQTTPQMLARFRQDVINLDPEVVVILAGTNDIAQNTGPISLEDIFANLVSMTELAMANGIKVVLSSVLPAYEYPWSPGYSPNIQIPKLNAMIREYAERNDIVYLDYFSALNDGNNGLKKEHSGDGVHPTLEGYKVMEPLAEKAIQKALKN